MRDHEAFDRTHQEALRRIWFLGDVHGRFDRILCALKQEPNRPSWLVFLGDIHLQDLTFDEALAPIRALDPELRIAFVHGNHDADEHEHWFNLHACGDAVALHGQVVEIDGIRLAGLGGNFMGRVWAPPANPSYASRAEATYRHPNLVERGQDHAPRLHAAIYKNELDQLASQQADILVTHEAYSCHPYGWEALDQLARDLGVVRAFHGHTHDDLSQTYQTHRNRMGFEVHAVNHCCIKNGLGHPVFKSVH